jgi:tetratricopeptide (TPR) repeat protein
VSTSTSGHPSLPSLLSVLILAPWSTGSAIAAPAAPLEVEFGGCEDITDEICRIAPDAELRLWVRAGIDARIEITGGTARPFEEAASVQGGSLWTVSVDPAASDIHVRDAASGSVWSLPVARTSTNPLTAPAAAAIASGDTDGALALLEALDAPDGDALGMLGRLYFRRGDIDAARASLRAAIAHKQRAGRELAAVKDATALAYSLMLKGRLFTEARRELDRFADTEEVSAEQRYYLAYFRGLLGYNAGDDRVTLRQLGAAAAQAERMGWADLQLTAEQTIAVQLQLLGRRADAAELLEGWTGRLDVLPDECERAMFLNNVGWTRLLALEAGEATDDPLPPLEQAYATFSSPGAGGLCNESEQVNGLLNLALAHLHAGNAEQAERYLERARTTLPRPELRMVLWSVDIEARLALLRGDPQTALARAEALHALGTAAVAPEAQWRAVVRKALALQQLGRPADALDAFAEADALIDRKLLSVPVNEGRETLLANHVWATKTQIALLLDQGREATAWALARRSNTRALRSLRPQARLDALDTSTQAAWEQTIARYHALRGELTQMLQTGWLLPRDELERITALHASRERELNALLDDALALLGTATVAAAAPLPAGTLELVFHPLPRGWVTFTARTGQVSAHTTQCHPASGGAEFAGCLLAPAAGAIAGAERVRLLPHDALGNVDLHAVEVDGRVLLDYAPVVYGLAMPAAEPPPARARPTQALLVGDGQGNLPQAREELRFVRDALTASSQPWQVTMLTGVSAELERVRDALQRTDLLHYAGHARALGARGWDSELILGARTALDVSDILSLSRVPRFIVLSGCETATTTADPTVRSGIGLAQAFVASGASGVIATARPVRDSTALDVMKRFYAAWLDGVPAAAALQRAQLRLRAEAGGADWSAFRLLER